MTALIEWHVLTGPVGRVMRSVTVVGGHRMPEGTPCCPDAATSVTYQLSGVLAGCCRAIDARIYGEETYEGAMATVYPIIVWTWSQEERRSRGIIALMPSLEV